MNVTATPEPIPWWIVFEEFYFNQEIPYGVGIWCILYGLAIIATVYIISINNSCYSP